MSASDAIRAESLTKIYRSGNGQVAVFDGLSLEVRQGERLAVIGESGAGKSTLLHLLGGLDRPTRGRILTNGRDITACNDFELAKFRNEELGFVWQNPSLLPEFTALENVSMPLVIRGSSPAEAERTARARLEEVGLSARCHHYAGELSGGEQQRVGLARALAANPRILLADEPTGNLDFRTGEMIMDLLAQLHTRHGLTSIFVTHNLAFAATCDRILELKKGSLHETSAMELQAIGVVQDATRPGGGTYV